MIWGTISDYFGRRPIMVACLLVLSLSCIGLALVPTSAYWLLIVLRCLQAAGSASTIAIGNISAFNYIYLLNVCRRWRDWRYIQWSRTWWFIWIFHAWSFGELKYLKLMFSDSVFTNFKIDRPMYRASSRRRTVRFIRLEVYHFVSLINRTWQFISPDPYFGFCVSQRSFVSW